MRYQNVREEHRTADGNNRIDIVVNSTDGHIFYEIKTYSVLQLSFRAAIGQLLEYAHFPNGKYATKLIIVSHLPITQDCQEYLEHLRLLTGLPIYYQQFDLNDQILGSLC